VTPRFFAARAATAIEPFTPCTNRIEMLLELLAANRECLRVRRMKRLRAIAPKAAVKRILGYVRKDCWIGSLKHLSSTVCRLDVRADRELWIVYKFGRPGIKIKRRLVLHRVFWRWVVRFNCFDRYCNFLALIFPVLCVQPKACRESPLPLFLLK